MERLTPHAAGPSCLLVSVPPPCPRVCRGEQAAAPALSADRCRHGQRCYRQAAGGQGCRRLLPTCPRVSQGVCALSELQAGGSELCSLPWGWKQGQHWQAGP